MKPGTVHAVDRGELCADTDIPVVVDTLGAWVINGLGGLCEHAVRSPDRHL